MWNYWVHLLVAVFLCLCVCCGFCLVCFIASSLQQVVHATQLHVCASVWDFWLWCTYTHTSQPFNAAHCNSVIAGSQRRTSDKLQNWQCLVRSLWQWNCQPHKQLKVTPYGDKLAARLFCVPLLKRKNSWQGEYQQLPLLMERMYTHTRTHTHACAHIKQSKVSSCH